MQTIVDEVQESEHKTSLLNHVHVATTDGELVGVQVAVDVNRVCVYPDSLSVGDATRV